ncbi:ABC transporter six-transmembrane domain-containing protein [Roseibium sediminicola]|uniref:ABC transporter six-transmembrane domain-containing protein n=1 Tax=Roseibium sediminicola TaxID=2933272 RepID=A0ABT0GSL7_9HYPH|nr:ABC transporter six-transmembrane domain-containing protein [Roseibium sp. CAU 1639]MCK7612441.1 ABC transporter six-transmembrane domain-containing protein [Roseibium sp. CAU 1639]
MRVRIDLAYVLKRFAGRIAVTWAIVLMENGLLALVPLSVGMTIDGLLAGRVQELGWLVAILITLGCVAVGRRFYDTRVYGTIRLRLGSELQRRNSALNVSKHSVRIDMSRELVDFLEIQVPELMTAVVQIGFSLVVLTWFDVRLGLSCALVVTGMLLVYACFHRTFYRFNGLLNDQKERQIDVLAAGGRRGVFRHLRTLRRHEVTISDTEAVLYGGIFLLQIAFVAFNLLQGSRIDGVSAGQFFSIATYSWDYVEAALLLPIALQSWSRLSEICHRLNGPEDCAPAPASQLPSQP